jgi:hypothetical protein
MGAIDDATGELLPGAHSVEQECAAGYLHVLLAIVREKGLPWSAYMDHHGSLKRNDGAWTVEEELRGEQDRTQVGAALKALDIEVIYALSPQAKGRVERLWGTLQDRLTSELRLAGTTNMKAANAVLDRHRPQHNRRFGVEAANAKPAWCPVRRGLDLEWVCASGTTPPSATTTPCASAATSLMCLLAPASAPTPGRVSRSASSSTAPGASTAETPSLPNARRPTSDKSSAPPSDDGRERAGHSERQSSESGSPPVAWGLRSLRWAVLDRRATTPHTRPDITLGGRNH